MEATRDEHDEVTLKKVLLLILLTVLFLSGLLIVFAIAGGKIPRINKDKGTGDRT